GIIVCCALFYGGKTLVLDPMNKTIAQKITEINEIEAQAPTDITTEIATGIASLTQQKAKLHEKVALLTVQEKYLEEHWISLGNPKRFSDIIFTLLPSSPVNLEENLQQMSITNTITGDGFKLHPVQISGHADFFAFFSYLQYIILSNTNQIEQPDESAIHFSLSVSRISLEEPI
ncbi:hypothetical protein ACFL6N_07435, partial [Thermodesulfobacteriota bacterium]